MLHVEAKARRDAECSDPLPHLLHHTHTHTHSPHPSLAPCSAEETETEFTFSSCGWFHCLPDCVRHISVYCPFLLWNEVAFLASFSLYLSLFFFFYPIIPPCAKPRPSGWVHEKSLECGMRHLWNWHWIWGRKKKSVALHTSSLLEVLCTSPLVSTSDLIWG